jgi:hypothetical protein
VNRILPITPLLLVLAGCEPKWDLNPSEDRLVRRWLMCEECTRGELDSVLRLGERGWDAMEHALRRGPTRKRRDNMRRQAEAMYARIPNPRISRQRYVDHYVANYLATYSSRAIIALRRFNTPSAQAALLRAIRPDTRHRHDVQRLLGEAVGTSLSKVAGDTQHAAVGTMLRTRPTVQVRDTLGRVLSNVRAVFRVDSGGGTVSDTIRLTDPHGTTSVEWRLGPAEGSNVLRVAAAGRVVRFRANGHPSGLRLVFLAQPTNLRVNQPLAPVRLVVQDAWGDTPGNFNSTATVSIPGIPYNAQVNVVGGVADLSQLRAPQRPGTGFRFVARSLGVQPAYSASFNVLP